MLSINRSLMLWKISSPKPKSILTSKCCLYWSKSSTSINQSRPNIQENQKCHLILKSKSKNTPNSRRKSKRKSTISLKENLIIKSFPISKKNNKSYKSIRWPTNFSPFLSITDKLALLIKNKPHIITKILIITKANLHRIGWQGVSISTQNFWWSKKMKWITKIY